MQSHIRPWLLAFAIAAVALGCRTSAPPESRQSLEQRASSLRAEAMRGGTPTPAQRAGYRKLADDVRAWQDSTGVDDPQVTQESGTTARRADGGGGGGDCEDCPGYRIHGDRICFLEKEEECPVDEGDDDLTLGRACVYTCIWIGSSAEPDASRAPGKPGS